MKGRTINSLHGAALGAVALASLQSQHALAQTAEQASVDVDASASGGDIIVTARRRDERSIDVPVAISAVTAQQLDSKGLTTLSAIAQQVPQLKVDTNIVSFGGTLTMRGVSSATSTASIEQAVTVNVDGVPISYAGVVRLGQFDLGQVEVLRGPQALFFGKNATGGIISLRSAEPTAKLSAMVRAGYEFEASEYFTEGYVSGPLSETVRARIAARYSDMDGWVRNTVPAGTPATFGPAALKAPGTEEMTVKGSLVFEPSNELTIKVGGTFGRVNTQGTSLAQRYYCPTGAPQGPSTFPGMGCTLDNEVASGDLNPALHEIDARFPTDGVPYSRLRQGLATADVTYKLGNDLTLSSLTGYYRLTLDTADHVTFGPIAIINFADSVRKRDISEELRLASAFAGPFNFMMGFFLQDDKFSQVQRDQIGARSIPYIGPLAIHGSTYSPFVQANYTLLDQVTLSGGVRYTHEVKRQSNALYGAQLRNRISFDDWSPEATLSWKPVRDVNLYVAYKEGYKSGGFQTEFISIPSALVAGANVDNSYGAEHVNGFEAGLKAILLDSSLRINMTAYHFKYKNLQLGRFDPVLVTTVIENIGASTSKGVEADFQYKTPLHGLDLSGAVAYNKSTYDHYVTACYNGQTAALGCDISTRNQDLAGKDLPRAPRWSWNLGANYEAELAPNFVLRLNGGVNHSGSYQTMSESIPAARQRAYTTYDAGVAMARADNRWEVAFIGRNLGNKFWASSSGQVPITGSAATPSDLFTTINRGRELVMRLTLRPFAR